MDNRIEWEAAVSALSAWIAPVPAQSLPWEGCAGRILATPIRAERDLPPFDQAALEGYAVRSADLTPARSGRTVPLTLVDAVPAGQEARTPLRAGQAVKVAVGSMLPAGCDAVLPLRDGELHAGQLAARRELWPFDNCMRQGSDCRAGTVLLPSGHRLNAAAMGLLALAGIEHLDVRRGVRVSLHFPPPVCTMLQTRLSELGITPEATSENADLLLADDRGIFPDAAPVFSGIRMWPGSAASFSLLDGRPLLTLPGGPAAVLAAFELLARPALAALNASRALLPPVIHTVLGAPYPKSSPIRRFVWAKLSDGHVLPTEDSLTGLTGCACLLDLPAGSDPLPEGAPVRVQVIRL